MKTLFSCTVSFVVSAVVMLCSATTRASALPVDKHCSGEGCQSSSSYVVSQSGIVCANCQAAVSTQVHPNVRSVSSIGRATAQGEKATESGAGRLESSHPVTVPRSQGDEQLNIIYQLYLPEQERGSNSLLPRPSITPSVDVSQLAGGGAGSHLASNLERATEVILEHWQGEEEQTFDKRLQMAKIRWPHDLSLPNFNRAIMAAMVLQDGLEATFLKEFEANRNHRSNLLISLAHFFLDLEREVVNLEAEAKSDDARDQEASAHFSDIDDSAQSLLPSLEALDKRLKALQIELGIKRTRTALFKQVFEDVYFSYRKEPSIRLSPWFTASEEPSTKELVIEEEEKRLGYFSEVLNYRKPPESAERIRLTDALAAMNEGESLVLSLGHIDWLIRRLEEGSSLYRLYLPGYWSKDFADSEALFNGIEVLHRSMMEAMSTPLEDDIRRRVNAHELGEIDGASLEVVPQPQQRSIPGRIKALMDRPITSAVVAVATSIVVTGGILTQQYLGGKSAPM